LNEAKVYADIILQSSQRQKEKGDKLGNVRIMWHAGVFVQPLLQLKTMSIGYPDSVFVALVNQYAMRVRHIICGLPTL